MQMANRQSRLIEFELPSGAAIPLTFSHKNV